MPTSTQSSDTPTTSPEAYRTERGRVLAEILEAQRAGLAPHLIELSEQQVFPYLIPCSPRTGRDARRSGTLLGRPAPVFVKRGRQVRYRLADVTAWLEQSRAFPSTAAALAGASAADH
ncbi:hypothetical protein [Halomonas sp. C05BenzN]|uniref:hypothetical protein n=1 Tax=Halomonas sp. C05BenzN TaxID=3411041 RepID=UPI003B93502D